MASVIAVCSRPLGKPLYCDAGDMLLHFGDYVVVDAGHGLDLAKVIIPEVEAQKQIKPLTPIVRQALPEDLENSRQAQEKEALVKCKEIAAKLGLKIKPLVAHYNLDGKHLTIFLVLGKELTSGDWFGN
jgi:PSP1 C-terminal conserved region.